ncbi:MAG TPA: pyridoxamine 5'-phosphate oxidase family protein [Puia sp.]|nr:pyridoxamine 5'-phosphate oxidase family protein [Puia sp.]
MVSQLPVKFLQQKIKQLQTALFFTDSDAVLKIPTHVITAAEMDESGQIWFFIPRPAQHIDAFDQDFPVKLDFFKKGKDFYLKIQGIASFITNKEELKEIVSAETSKKIEDRKLVAIRVKIRNADYFENMPKPASVNWIITGKNHLYNWLFNSQYDYKNPQLITIPITVDHREAYTE